ncbi:YidE/YbjL duplication [Roseomonas terrae]|jgi:putative transport protein|uniref:YidE/YbjL duplication n=1 Tax=Neoroseomonas terrae TaxID=424799 RepID=A0ABS5EQ01_9PROT|nr:TrkA C-terminal domain-containing protein [Neoroseomonas terrae]MBR0653045.1 YidE/YbjL duplication [Neoroseomonas terrae]
MALLGSILEGSPMLALFIAIGLGYALGQIPVLGVTFGAGAVLFSGLAIGAIAPRSAPPGLVGTLGLLMFLYGTGIQYGAQCVAGLKGPGLRWIVLALVAVIAALFTAQAVGSVLGLSPAIQAGMFAGAGTSTSALQAAITAAGGGPEPTIGYAVAYPIGVIGPILLMSFVLRLFHPKIPTPSPTLRHAEITLRPDAASRTVAEISASLPEGVTVLAMRHNHQNAPAEPGARLSAGDGLLILGPPAAVNQAVAALGEEEEGRLAKDRADLDVIRVIVSKPAFRGCTLATMPKPSFPVRVAQVRRGDSLMPAGPDLELEYGDVLVLLAEAGRRPDLVAHFGDSVKGNAELSFVSMGIGMAIGLLVGLITIPLPGGGNFSLGVAGGPLVVALFLGWRGSTFGIGWRMPVAANMVLRNFGLSIFLGQVAIASGRPFVDTVAAQGLAVLLGAALVLATIVLTVLLVGHLLLRIRMDDLFGVCSGATGNPAILAGANRMLGSDRADVGYAIVFPTMTIAKIIAVQFMLG